MSQAIRGARSAAPDRADLHAEVARETAKFLAQADFDRSPPDLAHELFARNSTILGNHDPFLEYKRRANARVKELLPELRAMVEADRSNGGDPLRKALNLAIIGNYMDAGITRVYDWEQALADEDAAAYGHDAYERFQAEVQKGARVLILGDNAGEIGLDTLLVAELLNLGCDVTFAVRGGPILNDATMDDAVEMGMTKLCRVLDSGLAAPGTILGKINAELQQELDAADVVLSKGQGNFEALVDRKPGVYFAFKAKCEVVAGFFGVEQGQSLFLYQ